MSTTHIKFEEPDRAEYYEGHWSSVPQEGQTLAIDGYPHEVTGVRWETSTIRDDGRLDAPVVHIKIKRL
jgi:hypothetical protein